MGALSPWRNNTTTVCKSPPCPWECTRPRCPRRIIRIIFIIRLTLLCWPSLILSVLNGKLFRKVTARWRWAGQRAADVFAYSFTGSSRAYHHLRYVAGMVLPLRNAMGNCRWKQLNMGVSRIFSTSVLHYLELFLREFFPKSYVLPSSWNSSTTDNSMWCVFQLYVTQRLRMRCARDFHSILDLWMSLT